MATYVPAKIVTPIPEVLRDCCICGSYLTFTERESGDFSYTRSLCQSYLEHHVVPILEHIRLYVKDEELVYFVKVRADNLYIDIGCGNVEVRTGSTKPVVKPGITPLKNVPNGKVIKMIEKIQTTCDNVKIYMEVFYRYHKKLKPTLLMSYLTDEERMACR